jgi:hypothetical protein
VHNRPRPAAADVQRVAGYLAKSVVHGLGGLEHASALLRCVRGMLSDMEAGGRCADDVRAWWDAWEGIKAEVDKVLVDRMGAPLRL